MKGTRIMTQNNLQKIDSVKMDYLDKKGKTSNHIIINFTFSLTESN